MNRREFLRRLSVLSGGALAAGAVAGCDLSEEHRRQTMNALFNVLIPSEPGKAGAVEAEALEMFRSDTLLTAAVNLGYIPKVAAQLAAEGASALETAIVVALDNAAGGLKIKKPKLKFVDLTPAERSVVVGQRFKDPATGLLLELARITAIFAFTSAVRNDKGLVAMGWPPYLDYAKKRHNNGYANFSYNQIPAVDGKKVWSIGLPDGNPA